MNLVQLLQATEMYPEGWTQARSGSCKRRYQRFSGVEFPFGLDDVRLALDEAPHSFPTEPDRLVTSIC